MVRVRLLEGDGDCLVGDFDFMQLPRKGEEITIPWPEDAYATRIFTVGEVSHYAVGAPTPDKQVGPLIVLRYCEEIN